MTDPNEALIEAAASAWRPRAVDGTVQGHPAWHDLEEADRVRVYEVALENRTIEAGLDADGLSSTGRAVLARIRAPR
jgi:hypothetical protein